MGERLNGIDISEIRKERNAGRKKKTEVSRDRERERKERDKDRQTEKKCGK